MDKDTIDNCFKYIEDEIDIRLESLNNKIEILGEQIIEELERRFEILLKKNACKCRKSFLRNLKRNNLLLLKQAQFKDLIECNLAHFLIEKNNSIFQKDQFGHIFWTPLPNIDNLKKKNSEVKFQKLFLKNTTVQDSCVRSCASLKSFCSLLEKFIVFADYRQNQIMIFDTEFTLKNSYNFIKNFKLDRPCSICTNDAHSIIYLINFGTQELLFISKTFDYIQKIISKLTFGANFYPIDCTFFKQTIYLLDRGNYRIMKLTEAGDFQKEFPLYNCTNPSHDDLLIWPLKIQVTSNIIAVLEDWKYIYVYDFDGVLKQIITDKSIYCSTSIKVLPHSDIQSFAILNNYLVYHSSDGTVSVLVESRGIFKFLLKRSFYKLSVKGTHICYYNGQLVMTIQDDNNIVLI